MVYYLCKKKFEYDEFYKIVVGEAEKPYPNCKKITVGKYYKLTLGSSRENAPIINGVKIAPVNYLDITYYCHDSVTAICIEPKRRIYDLYFTDDLRGLYYIRKSRPSTSPE